MQFDKWVKLRIFLVFEGIAFLFAIIMFRFAYLQLKDHFIIALLLMSLFIGLLCYFIISLFNELNLHSKNIIIKQYNESIITENSIIDLISNNKIRQSAISYIILLISYLIFLYSYINYSKEYFDLVTVIVFILIILIFIDICLLEYRIKRGYYGSIDYEAREIIRFILTMPSNINFKNGDPFNNLFQSQEQYEPEKLQEKVDRIKGTID